jgi:leucyl aminopeptidase (aminopeptidase T)
MSEILTAEELRLLVQRVFQPTAADTGLAVIVDVPDARLADNDDWRARRRLAAGWAAALQGERDALGLPRVTLAWYRNAGGNNADLPAICHPAVDGEVPDNADRLPGQGMPFAQLFAEHSIVMAPTELSATAPLKVATRDGGFRAATMPGFLPSMIPALRLDYGEINRRVNLLKELLDQADGAELHFRAAGRPHQLRLDLRHRTGHASGGLVPANGVAGNLPSGEAYIVPYEGEREGDPSGTGGSLPVQIGDELVIYRIEGNRVVEVLGDGPAARAEADHMAAEPAYANVAELGLGVLGDFGLQPTGEILLDEKLGLHIAFGRSDHFGGTVGPADFSGPDAVIHLDRVYIPQTQPQVRVDEVRLVGPGLERMVIRDGEFVGLV